MTVSASNRWRAQLEAWAIPQHLLEAVEESPYGWPSQLWRRRSDDPGDGSEPVTLAVARSLLSEPGTVLDVGAGTGRASLPLAAEGHELIAVERDAGMAAGLRDEAVNRRLEIRVVEEAWPEAAALVGRVDVAMSAHVVYDVQDIAPFVAALHSVCRRGVVLELTESHPWSHLAPYYRALHGLDRPGGPTADDLTDVVREVLRLEPHVERWERSGAMWFEDRDEILTLFRRRLVLPPSRTDELWRLLEPHIVEHPDGRLTVGDDVRQLVTLWWETTGTKPVTAIRLRS